MGVLTNFVNKWLTLFNLWYKIKTWRGDEEMTNRMEIETYMAKAENMALRVEIMGKVPAKKGESVLNRWRRMVDYAIANGYIK